MSFNTVSVGTSATLIIAADNSRRFLNIVNSSSTVMYIGPDSSITTSTALTILGWQSFNIRKDFGDYKGDVYGIVASGTNDVRYWQELGS